MYDGPVARCLLASHVKCAPTGQTDGRTDGCQTVTLRFPVNAVSVIIG